MVDWGKARGRDAPRSLPFPSRQCQANFQAAYSTLNEESSTGTITDSYGPISGIEPADSADIALIILGHAQVAGFPEHRGEPGEVIVAGRRVDEVRGDRRGPAVQVMGPEQVTGGVDQVIVLGQDHRAAALVEALTGGVDDAVIDVDMVCSGVKGDRAVDVQEQAVIGRPA